MNRNNVVSIAVPEMTPIEVGGGFGLLHRGAMSGKCGVVLCSPWGIDELAARKILFRLGGRLAAAGIPAIRFDYPGTADALDRPAPGFGSWIDAASMAADSLKAACGLETVIFAGLGIGATIAMLASARRDDVSGLVLGAPVVGGRRYLREIALGAAAVEQGLGLDASQRPDGVSIGGIVMPPVIATELKSIDLMTADAGAAKPVLLVQRPAQPQEDALAAHLETLGWSVDRTAFEGYDGAMNNPTIAEMPEHAMNAIAAWVANVAPRDRSAAPLQPAARSVIVHTRQGKDEAISFGPGLFGVLTHPAISTTDTTVVFVNSGYDHHAGWAYQTARAAQALAASGIASLRFDTGNVGDSPARRGAAEQVLYGETQQADMIAAIDMLAARGEGPVLLAGRCSGAFAAFQIAARDLRVAGAVIINPFRLVWDPDEDVDVMIRFGPRSLADYKKRALSGKVVSRLLTGDIHVWGVVKSLSTQLGRRLAQAFAPLAGSLSRSGRLRRQCLEMFASISRRGTPVHMVFSKGDATLEHMAVHFGGDFHRLRLFPGAAMTLVPDADHNMTPHVAQDQVVDVIREMARQISSTDSRPAEHDTVERVSKMAG